MSSEPPGPADGRLPTRIGLEIDEACYEPDQRVMQGFQSYSTELLRLSLLGIGAIGFMLKDVVLSQGGAAAAFDQKLMANGWSVVAALVSFAAAASFALAHRNLSTDAFASLIMFIRLNSPKSPVPFNPEKAGREQHRIRSDLKLASWALVLSAVSLGLGAAFFTTTFILLLTK